MAVQFAFSKIVTEGLALAVDAADPNSYPGTGTTWRDVTPNNNSGTITGSIAYSTAYKGGFVFSGPTASVTFSTASANFGTGSFTVEMAFSPSSFTGRHWLFSKNSGSFPSFGAYLSGSGGTATLWSEYRVSSTISCSISASTVFTTGSIYQVDFRYAPGLSASGFVVNGVAIGGGLGNNAGSLTNTGSFYLGNTAPSSSQAFLGSIYAVKLYSANSIESANRNFNAIGTRFNLPLITDTAKKTFDLLIIGGGGSGGAGIGGGGGAGGLLTYTLTDLPSQRNTVVVGDGGAGAGGANGNNGANSNFGSLTAFGGGRAGYNNGSTGSNGGSGGGGWGGESQGGPFQPGTGSLGQGNSGGIGYIANGGGGGGAGTVGTNAGGGYSYIPGIGGSGSYIASFAAIGGFPAGWFAGGGSAAAMGVNTITQTPFGGGGGNTGGSFTGGTTGSSNTGAGGGGGTNGGAAGGKGGSGIVAIRYSGGPIGVGGEITQSAGYTYHVFRTVGTSVFTLF
jgi:hypothetical protein